MQRKQLWIFTHNVPVFTHDKRPLSDLIGPFLALSPSPTSQPRRNC
jgi:hypothetical protein